MWSEDFKSLFSVLPTNLQWSVHRYFLPTEELTNQELTAYRRSISKLQPSLPQRASKAFARMQTAFDAAYEAFEAADRNDKVFFQTLTHFIPARGKGKIHVVAVARPEPDYQHIARALVERAHRELLKERGRVA